MDKTYIAIDLKSFYASVECADRKLDPMTTNLVVADKSRTEKTICLAVSPSLKANGVPGRPRLFEVIEKVKQINEGRLKAYQSSLRNFSASFTGNSYNASKLKEEPSLELSYIVATPRMNRYMEVSSEIVGVYLKYVAPEDIIIYSIDEVFIDATGYLNTYRLSAKEFAMKMIKDVLGKTGITATAGIGTNLYLAKVAMDIVAKHISPDENGVRMAELNEMSYRKILWEHKPLTDFWRLGPGIAKKLADNGMHTMSDVARMSCTKTPVMIYLDKPLKNESKTMLMNNGEDLLYRLLGVNAELLIDHAWGWEPCTIDVIKQYVPENKSISQGQVLHEPYTFPKARVIIMEMAEELSLDLVRKGLVTDRVTLYIEFARESLCQRGTSYKYSKTDKPYRGKVTKDHYGRVLPIHANGTRKLTFATSSSKLITKAIVNIYDENVDSDLLVRRVNISADVYPESEIKEKESKESFEQLDFFMDYTKKEKEEKDKKEELDKEKRLQKAMLDIKDRFGKNAILKGTNFREGARGMERNNEVGGHKGG